MAKLVRDKIDALFEGRALKGTFRSVEATTPDTQRTLLVAKLLEECAEVLTAADIENIRKELGDVQSLAWAIGKLYDISPMSIALEAQSKDQARGGFDRMLYMDLEDTAPEVRVEKEIVYRNYPVNDNSYGSWGGVGYSG